MKFLDGTGLEKLWSLIRGVTDGIQSEVEAAQSAASAAQTAASAAQTTANAAQTAASAAQTAADAAQATATSAESTASTASTVATAARTTANSASSTASTAVTTANSASSAASAAQTTANEALELAEDSQRAIAVSRYTFQTPSTSRVTSTSQFCVRSVTPTSVSWAPADSLGATYSSTYGRFAITSGGVVLVWAIAYVGIQAGQTLAFGIGAASSSSSYSVSTTYYEGLYQNTGSSAAYQTVVVPPTLIYNTSTVYVGPYMRSSTTPSDLGDVQFHIMRLRSN